MKHDKTKAMWPMGIPATVAGEWSTNGQPEDRLFHSAAIDFCRELGYAVRGIVSCGARCYPYGRRLAPLSWERLLSLPDERKGAVLNGYIFRAVYVLRFGHWHYQPCYPDNEKEVIAAPFQSSAITSSTM